MRASIPIDQSQIPAKIFWALLRQHVTSLTFLLIFLQVTGLL